MHFIACDFSFAAWFAFMLTMLNFQHSVRAIVITTCRNYLTFAQKMWFVWCVNVLFLFQCLPVNEHSKCRSAEKTHNRSHKDSTCGHQPSVNVDWNSQIYNPECWWCADTTIMSSFITHTPVPSTVWGTFNQRGSTVPCNTLLSPDKIILQLQVWQSIGGLRA